VAGVGGGLESCTGSPLTAGGAFAACTELLVTLAMVEYLEVEKSCQDNLNGWYVKRDAKTSLTGDFNAIVINETLARQRNGLECGLVSGYRGREERIR
jgi:hypothetical protein